MFPGGVCIGVGFVGRHLTTYIVESQLASHVRLVDKAPPATGWLNEKHKVNTASCFRVS